MEINLNIEKRHFIIISVFLGLIVLTLATDMITAAVVPVVGGVWHPLSGISGDGGVTSIDNGSGYIRADAIEGGGSGVPTGAIIMWVGTLASIPSGWQFCNGTGGTPNLTSRFVRGTADGVDPGNTGGEDEHKLTVAEMPSHTHGINVRYDSTGNGLYAEGSPLGVISTYNTNPTGNDVAHNNMPAFFEVAFICKI